MSDIGRRVYHTNVSVYNNMTFLKDFSFIEIRRRKNKIIPFLTQKGIDIVNKEFNRLNVTKDL